MNKNLKRALNTTAAVSMSLAMVLGAVAPVSANVPTANATIETVIEQKNKVVELLNKLGDVTVIPSDEKLGVATNGDTAETTNATFAEVLESYEQMLVNANKYAAVAGYTEEQQNALSYLVGTKIGNDTKNATDWAADLVSETTLNKLKDYKGKVDTTHLETYKEVSALMAYKGNVATNKLDTLETIEGLFADLESDVKDYKEDNITAEAKKFAAALAEKHVANNKKVKQLVDEKVAISYKNLAAVENFVKTVTKDSYELDGVKYGDVKEEDVVADYIEALETIVSEMKDAKELIADTKDEQKAFGKLSAKIKALADVAKTGEDNEAQLDKIDEAIAAFRSEDVKTLKTYVDTVVNEFWTVAVDQRTSGSYRVKEVDAGLGRYYGFEEVAGADLHKLMTTLVERDGEDTYYDLLVADAASVDELLKAVTTDIEGMTMNSVMTNQQAAKIIAAKKALTKLDADNQKIYKTLTRAERAEVDANREMIEVLYVKLLLNGEVTTIGSVETAKGWVILRQQR